VPESIASGPTLTPLAGGGQRGPLAATAVVVGAVTVLAATVLTGTAVKVSAPVVTIAVIAAIGWRKLLTWQALIALTIATVMFIPIKRYSLPASLPFHLEPYRVLIFAVVVAWGTSLLIDPRVRLRATPIDWPLFLFLFAILGSLLANSARVGGLEQEVVKRLAFFLSFFFVFYLMVSCLRQYRQIEFIVKVLVGCGTVVGLAAIVESRTNYNVFNHLSGVLPGLRLGAIPIIVNRGARLRVYASAQHPIALSAALVMLLPLTFYLYKRTQRQRWLWCALAIGLGGLSAIARTGVVMLMVIGLVYLVLNPSGTRRLWPALLPLLVVIHFALPGTLGTLRSSFFPKGGLIAQQNNAAVGSGRLATFGPALHYELSPDPLLGEGFGTRVTQPDEIVRVPNGPILDDQWLGILLETGIIGFSLLAFVIIRFITVAGRTAKRELSSPRGQLLAATVASVTAFAVGMWTFDAFSFIQVTFLFFFFLGLGAAALRVRDAPPAFDAEPS
jgi:hypothetical protein